MTGSQNEAPPAHPPDVRTKAFTVQVNEVPQSGATWLSSR